MPSTENNFWFLLIKDSEDRVSVELNVLTL